MSSPRHRRPTDRAIAVQAAICLVLTALVIWAFTTADMSVQDCYTTVQRWC